MTSDLVLPAFQMPRVFQADNAGDLHTTFQFNMSGEGGINSIALPDF